MSKHLIPTFTPLAFIRALALKLKILIYFVEKTLSFVLKFGYTLENADEQSIRNFFLKAFLFLV